MYQLLSSGIQRAKILPMKRKTLLDQLIVNHQQYQNYFIRK